MGKFTEFKQKQYEERRKRSLALPAELVSHGNHSLTTLEKVEKLRRGRENVESGKQPVSEAKMADDVERTKEEHAEVHKLAPVPKGLNQNEHESLQRYSDDSKDINLSLINYHNGHSWRQSHNDYLSHLDKALEKTKTTKDTTLYSGIKWSPSTHLVNKPENATHVDIHLPAFTSTSSSLNQAVGFAEPQMPHRDDEKNDVMGHEALGSHRVRHVLRIHVPKGTHAMSMLKHTFAPIEKEVLLHRGHEIQMSVKPQRHFDRNGDPVNIWDAHITGHYPANPNEEDL